MAFHADFWVATSTAAPVIALTAVVTASNAARQAGKVTTPGVAPTPGDKWVRIFWLMMVTYLLAGVNILIQLAVINISLDALAAERDTVSVSIAASLTEIGLCLIVLSAGSLVFAQMVASDAAIAQRGKMVDTSPDIDDTAEDPD